MTEFIFMLTREDVTVSDALVRYGEVRSSELRWVGFKDVGLPFEGLRSLADAIHADGRKVALEVVSLDRESEVRSAEAALEIGVDLLMGGVHPEAVLPLVASTNVLYFPFTGRVVDHPSILEGSVDDIAAHARMLTAQRGIHGLDLLAYRFAGDVPSLMAAVVAASIGPVVVAGSVDSDARIRAVRVSGAWAFTVGSAVFDHAFPAPASTLAQVEHVFEAVRDSGADQGHSAAAHETNGAAGASSRATRGT
jgi:4-hydroxythreonine-4-phosphate dehydrogenase